MPDPLSTDYLREIQARARLRSGLAEPIGPARLAAVRDSVARNAATPQARVIRDLVAEIDRLQAPAARRCPLTDGQMSVLIGTARGETVSETARRLDLKYHNIRSRQRAIRDKLGARSAAHAVAIAVSHGWLRAHHITTPTPTRRTTPEGRR
ncbi:LuxR C-terminal-related transcriptional regulator [Streptomyces sp. NPDC087851]|uniref:helix-turn-helix transcriptional regulator n=1 Tax=Streptomyces sp. NPDC087851 TaxID=3365810 RepID=UPI0037FBECCE